MKELLRGIDAVGLGLDSLSLKAVVLRVRDIFGAFGSFFGSFANLVGLEAWI